MYNKLAELCKKNNVSITKVCHEIGISPSVISNCKKRGNQFNVNTLNKFAEYFSVSTDYFFGIEEDQENERLATLMNKCSKLNSANLALVESLVDTILDKQE